MQDMQASLTLTARRDPALQAELARARAGLGELREETRRTGQAQAQAASGATALGAAEGRLGAILDRNAAQLRQLRDETVRAAAARAAAMRADLAAASAADSLAASQLRLGAASAGNRLGLQNVAFQVQDIAVQMQAGTSASVALGQNLPQLLGGFGALGAIAGAVVAVMGPLAFTLLGMGGAADKTADATDRLADATDRLRDLSRTQSDMAGLREQYGQVTAAIWKMIEAEREHLRIREMVEAATVRDTIAGAIGAIGADNPTLRTSRLLFDRNALFDRDARAAANRVGRAAAEFEAQRTSFLGMADAAAALRDAIVEGAGGFDRLNPRADELVEQLNNAEKEFREAAAATGEVGTGIDFATERAIRLTAELGRARESLASLAAEARDRLARAQISLDFAGDPAGAGRAEAELAAKAELERARAAAAGLADLKERHAALEDANRQAQAFVDRTIDAERAERLAAAAAEGIARALDVAVGRATALANEAARARANLAGIGLSAAEGRARAELELEHRDDPVTLARKLAEREAGQRLRDVVTTQADIPTALRPDYVAEQRAIAAQFVEDRTAEAAARERRRALDSADSRAARGGAAGARRGEREAERVREMISDMEAETAAIMRRIEAERQGADAVREAMALEEQEQALRRAGLTLADLAGGKEQARAQAIAGASRALFEVQSAEEAMAETRQAFAAEIGLSYDQMRSQAERWRDSTLLALEGAGAGHEDYAEQVQSVFRQRLEDAYRQDLDRRTDWAAGVERAMLDITESTADMATLSEDIIKQSFQGAEDAFVELATTGKLQVGDLVEFSIRQFYRLAQAAAIDLAGGGGGGLLGSLFSSITGIALGGGSFTVGGGSALGGFSANPSSFTPGGAFPSLHGGGFRADAGTRIVDPAVFAGAPRLHGGGLRPGEFAAVLEDDERVLTVAQQESTARTIQGLARLSTVSGASAGGGAPVVTLNVYGGQGDPQKTQAQARQDGDGGLTVDVFLDQVDAGMARRIATGRGATAAAIQHRFELQPRGAR